MKLRIVYLLALLVVPFMSCEPAAERPISGVVTDLNEGMPLPGVDVLLKGTDVKVQTDFDGLYEIKAKKGDVLVLSYLRMETQEVKVTSKDTLDVQLKPVLED